MPLGRPFLAAIAPDRDRRDARDGPGPGPPRRRRRVGPRLLREEGPTRPREQLLQLPLGQHQRQGRPPGRRPQRPAPGRELGPGRHPRRPRGEPPAQGRRLRRRPKMPPKKQLSSEQVADLAAWIKAGAPGPRRKRSSSKVNPNYESSQRALGLAAARRPETSGRPRRRLAARRCRPFPPRRPRSEGPDPVPGCRPAGPDPPGDLRPDRPAPHARGDRRIRADASPTASRPWSTACSPRRGSASNGGGTGSTSPGTASRPARRGTCRSPTPGGIATT